MQFTKKLDTLLEKAAMARIPDSVLSQLKRLDLVELVRRSGVELKRQGKNWSGCARFIRIRSRRCG